VSDSEREFLEGLRFEDKFPEPNSVLSQQRAHVVAGKTLHRSLPGAMDAVSNGAPA